MLVASLTGPHQLEDDEAERDHGQGPPRPTHEQIARVAEGHHRRRSQAQAPTQSLRLLNASHTAPGSTRASPLPSRSSPPFSQVVDRRTHEFSSASGHSTCCWDCSQCTKTQTRRLSNQQTHSPSTSRRNSGHLSTSRRRHPRCSRWGRKHRWSIPWSVCQACPRLQEPHRTSGRGLLLGFSDFAHRNV